MPKVSSKYRDAQRQRILLAAMACFARDGFHRTTMAQIASEAGLSDGLAYRYFSGKDEIVAEVVRQESARSHLPLEESDALDDVPTMMRMLISSSFGRFDLPDRMATLRLRFRAWAEALDNAQVRDEVVSRWHMYGDVEASLWARAQAQGMIPVDLDPQAVGRVMQAIHDGLDLMWSLDPDLDVARCREVVLAMASGRFWHESHDSSAASEPDASSEVPGGTDHASRRAAVPPPA